MAPSRSERGRGRSTRFNSDQGRLPLIVETTKLVAKLHTYDVVRAPGEHGGRFLEIKDLNGSVVRTVPLTEGEDFTHKLRLELDILEGRGNRGRGGVFTKRKL